MNNSFYYYFKLIKFFSRKKKIYLLLLLFLSLLTSLTELLSIGSLVPFITLLINPNKIYENAIFSYFINKHNLDFNNLILILFIAFVLLIITSTSLKILYLRLNSYLSFGIIKDISNLLFNKIINKTYYDLLKLDSKDISTTIVLRCQSAGETNYFFISGLGSLIIIFFLLINILYFISFKFIYVLFPLFLMYVFFFFFIKKKISEYSKTVSDNFEKITRNVQQIIKFHSEIILYKLNNFFFIDFNKDNYNLRKAQEVQTFISSYPSIIIQNFVIIVLIFLIYYLYSDNILKDKFPILVLLFFSIQRIMPNLQNIFQCLTVISFQKDMLKKTFEVLDHNENDNRKNNDILKNNFDSLIFENVHFAYDTNKVILSNINFKINKKDVVALTGESGAGKTTLVKIIVGFLKPTKGRILLNNTGLNEDLLTSWHLNIAYIPQQIFILDESLIENIALSKNISLLEKENIHSILKKLNLNYNDFTSSSNRSTGKVGEDGKFFSGGQIQRIGLARAIFQKREFLILDESINALDDKNLNLVISFLKKIEDITILIISHDKRVINFCNKVLEIKNNTISTILNK